MVYQLTDRDRFILEYPIDFQVSKKPGKDHNFLELALLQFNFPTCLNEKIIAKGYGAYLYERSRSTKLSANQDEDFISPIFQTLIKYLRNSFNNSISSRDLEFHIDPEIWSLFNGNESIEKLINLGKEWGLFNINSDEEIGSTPGDTVLTLKSSWLHQVST